MALVKSACEFLIKMFSDLRLIVYGRAVIMVLKGRGKVVHCVFQSQHTTLAPCGGDARLMVFVHKHVCVCVCLVMKGLVGFKEEKQLWVCA